MGVHSSPLDLSLFFEFHQSCCTATDLAIVVFFLAPVPLVVALSSRPFPALARSRLAHSSNLLTENGSGSGSAGWDTVTGRR